MPATRGLYRLAVVAAATVWVLASPIAHAGLAGNVVTCTTGDPSVLACSQPSALVGSGSEFVLVAEPGHLVTNRLAVDVTDRRIVLWLLSCCEGSAGGDVTFGFPDSTIFGAALFTDAAFGGIDASSVSYTDHSVTIHAVRLAAGENFDFEYAKPLVVDLQLSPFTAPDFNFQGLWSNANEPGWGINFAHQGDVIFATWFTFGADGKPVWFASSLQKAAAGVYSGDVFTATGPPFTTVPFASSAVVETTVGSMTVTFVDANAATVAYTINAGALAVTQEKIVTRQQFAGRIPTCAFGASPNPIFDPNYQDLWWAAPPNLEPGWGVNLAHQGDTIFVTWFTYGADGKPTWLIAVAKRHWSGMFQGPISTVTGPAFNAAPWDSTQVVETVVGLTTLIFADGNHGHFAYTVDGITQAKLITRQVFAPPGTVCQ